LDESSGNGVKVKVAGKWGEMEQQQQQGKNEDEIDNRCVCAAVQKRRLSSTRVVKRIWF